MQLCCRLCWCHAALLTQPCPRRCCCCRFPWEWDAADSGPDWPAYVLRLQRHSVEVLDSSLSGDTAALVTQTLSRTPPAPKVRAWGVHGAGARHAVGVVLLHPGEAKRRAPAAAGRWCVHPLPCPPFPSSCLTAQEGEAEGSQATRLAARVARQTANTVKLWKEQHKPESLPLRFVQSGVVLPHDVATRLRRHLKLPAGTREGGAGGEQWASHVAWVCRSLCACMLLMPLTAAPPSCCRRRCSGCHGSARPAAHHGAAATGAAAG